jgi:GR25 family glycosyltransferase involved in LPS biosynthesis
MRLRFVEAIIGKDATGQPANWPNDNEGFDGAKGCMMSHVKAMRYMVKHNVQSALVMEDDADWDIRIKQALPEFARGARQLTDRAKLDDADQPYGDNWDMLWMGHCGTRPSPYDENVFSFNDATVPPLEQHRSFLYPPPDMSHYPPQTRLLYPPIDGYCTSGVAVSLRGAKKFLKIYDDIDIPIDMWNAYICRIHPTFNCLTPYPQIISMHKAAGNTTMDSDIPTSIKSETEFRKKGETDMVEFSAQENAPYILKSKNKTLGIKDYIRQW